MAERIISDPASGIVFVALGACVLLFVLAIVKQLRQQPKEEKKSVHDIAVEVLAGLWGNGQDRIDRLSSAGYDPAEVQAAVNELLERRGE